MPDLYAISLYLQERLEREWRDEVRAVEAAGWLDHAGLLKDHKNGLSLRNLLRAGRIAGQEQRPNQKNGLWFIHRLAKSRNPREIRQARERMRRYLPVDRKAFPSSWPVNRESSTFWQELGKTVATFGYLEDIIASTCFAILSTTEKARVLLDTDDDVMISQWFNRIKQSQVDALHGLNCELDQVLKEDVRVPHTVREDLIVRLMELRSLRSALCHGAWINIQEDESGYLRNLHQHDGFPVAFEPKFSLEDISSIRSRTVDAIFRIAEAASIAGPDNIYVAGAGYAFVVAMPRQFEPSSGSSLSSVRPVES